MGDAVAVAIFHSTRWSMIRRARTDDASGRAALEELCSVYWRPVYTFYRAEGLPAVEAEDLAQGLFAAILSRGDLQAVDAQRGRFRAWLKACARHHLTNVREHDRAQKRGGGRLHRPLDFGDEESKLSLEPADHNDPARAFDRRWAQLVLEQAQARLEESERRAGRGQQFEILRYVLDGGAPLRPWAELAERLQTTEGALRVAAHRLRERFRQSLLAEVRETLDEESEGSELQELMAALSRR